MRSQVLPGEVPAKIIYTTLFDWLSFNCPYPLERKLWLCHCKEYGAKAYLIPFFYEQVSSWSKCPQIDYVFFLFYHLHPTPPYPPEITESDYWRGSYSDIIKNKTKHIQWLVYSCVCIRLCKPIWTQQIKSIKENLQINYEYMSEEKLKCFFLHLSVLYYNKNSQNPWSWVCTHLLLSSSKCLLGLYKTNESDATYMYISPPPSHQLSIFMASAPHICIGSVVNITISL